MSLGTIPVLCIIPARLHSTRLPHKMLLTLGDETLIARAWRIANAACHELYEWVAVVAIPKGDEAGLLGDELRRIGARIFAWDGPEWDVLGRFYHCAHTYRWHPETVIVRYTADDFRKSPEALRAVARGFRVPVEQGGEAFTLAQLDAAHVREDTAERREHLTVSLFPVAPPTPPPGVWTIDTMEDYERAQAELQEG